MTVEVYTDLSELPVQTVNRLSLESGLPFFKSIEWFRCLVGHGIGAGSPRLYISLSDDTVQCALYCFVQDDRLSSLSNFYTIEYGPVMTGPDAETGLQEIISHIAAERPRWTTIDLRNLHEIDLQRLSEAFEPTEFTTHAWFQTQNWYLDVNRRPFDKYYRTLNSRLRNTIRRKSRKAERDHTIRLAVYPDEGLTLDEAIDHYQTIYAASWKQPEPFPGFMPALFRTCNAHDAARVGMAWIDDEPAAVQLWINDNREGHKRTIIYKLAYDEKFSSLSIGSLLSLKMFQHAIDTDHVKEIDYGVGNEPYKRDWMSASRTLSGLLACNRRTVRGQLRNLRERIGAIIRRR